jgi:hypothetical protein
VITFAQRPKNENKLGDERVPPERHNDSRNFGDECKEYKENFKCLNERFFKCDRV